MLRRLTLICWIVLLASVVRAQNSATAPPIAYGQAVSGSLTDQSFFDHWQLSASAGDRVYIRMTAADGLRPLIGILSAGGTLLAHSANGDANGSIDLAFTISSNGTYIVVATRVDNQFGATTGSYTLEVKNLNAAPTRDPLFQDVTFQCAAFEATALASLHFAHEDTDNGAYSLRVYGFAGFQPVIRIQSGDQDTCITDPADALGDVITLPGERPVTLAQSDLSHTAQAVIASQNLPDPSSITLMIGSADGQPGRYVALIGGFAIEPSTDVDEYDLRLAPRPAQGSAPLLFYVIGGDNRLDPSVVTETSRCDDAGRRGCDDVPSIVGAGVILNNGVRVVGDRFDAGARLSDAALHQIHVLSFSGTTDGSYALLLIGSLPPAPN